MREFVLLWEKMRLFFPLRRKTRRSRLFFLTGLIFIAGCVGLFLLNQSFLWNPPYGNDITALHRQAIWLANHRFDVHALWDYSQTFPNGGANAYPFGIMPYLFGILYTLFPASEVHGIIHCLNAIWIVAAFSLCFYLIARMTGRMVPALLWSLVALADPVIQGRSADLGHESVLLFLIMVWLVAVFSGKMKMAFFLVCFMCFIKMSALVVFLAFLAWCALMMRGNSRSVFERVGKCLLPGFCIVSLLYGITAVMDELNFLISWDEFFRHVGMLHYLMFLTGSAILAVLIVGTVRYSKTIVGLFRGTSLSVSRKDQFLLLLFLCVAVFEVAFLFYPEPCPRNAAMVSFPMALFAGILASRKQGLHGAALLLVICGLLVSEHDIPKFPEGVNARSSDLLERNLAFVEDLHANRKACALIEKCADDVLVIASPPFSYMLTIPEMGYVKRPIENLASDNFRIEHCRKKRLYVSADNFFNRNPPPDDRDMILYENRISNQSVLYVYLKHIDGEDVF